MNESQKKNMDGKNPSNFFQASRRIALVYQLVVSCIIADLLYYKQVSEKNLDGKNPSNFFQASSRIALIYQLVCSCT